MAGLGWATLGLVWLVAGVLFFPRVVLVPGSGGHTGFLLWPQGAVLWVVGLWRAVCAFLPALAEWQRRHATLVALAGAAAWGLLIWATWRG